MLGGQLGIANGGIARVCAGRVSVVPALVAAVPALGIDAAADGLDGQYFANLPGLALAVARAGVAGSRLGPAAGIWIGCSSRRDRVASRYGPTGRTRPGRADTSRESSSGQQTCKTHRISC